MQYWYLHVGVGVVVCIGVGFDVGVGVGIYVGAMRFLADVSWFSTVLSAQSERMYLKFH